MRWFTLVLMSTAVVLACFSQALAGTLLSDDFESYSLGTWPSNWVKDANASDSANNGVFADPTNPSNKTLKLYGQVGGDWSAVAYGACAFPTNFTIETDVYNGSENLSGVHPERGWIGLIQGTFWANPGMPLLQFANNGTIVDASGSVLQSYETQQWYNVKIQYDRVGTTRLLTYWIDGIDRGTISQTISDLSTEQSYDHLELQAAEGSAYFDNVQVNSVPEPSTFALLGVGAVGLLAYAWRRHGATA